MMGLRNVAFVSVLSLAVAACSTGISDEEHQAALDEEAAATGRAESLQ